MIKTKEQSKEMATFCRQHAKQSNRGTFKSWIGNAALQGIMAALFGSSFSSGFRVSQTRTNPWVVG
jgi:hypothetical protein